MEWNHFIGVMLQTVLTACHIIDRPLIGQCSYTVALSGSCIAFGHYITLSELHQRCSLHVNDKSHAGSVLHSMALSESQNSCSSSNPFIHERGFREIRDEDGNFICNVIESNGRLHSVFGDNMAERLDSYRKSFPVFDDDIYLLTYPKSGKQAARWVLDE